MLQVKYGVRKSFADSRMRIKGRFVKKEDEAVLREMNDASVSAGGPGLEPESKVTIGENTYQIGSLHTGSKKNPAFPKADESMDSSTPTPSFETPVVNEPPRSGAPGAYSSMGQPLNSTSASFRDDSANRPSPNRKRKAITKPKPGMASSGVLNPSARPTGGPPTSTPSTSNPPIPTSTSSWNTGVRPPPHPIRSTFTVGGPSGPSYAAAPVVTRGGTPHRSIYASRVNEYAWSAQRRPMGGAARPVGKPSPSLGARR